MYLITFEDGNVINVNSLIQDDFDGWMNGVVDAIIDMSQPQPVYYTGVEDDGSHIWESVQQYTR